MGGLKARLADQAVAVRTHAGESVSGDAWWIEESAAAVRAAVADGLGHGPEAAAAANQALALVRAAANEDVTTVIKRCHAGLQRTRGAALSLVHLDAIAGTLTWIGVGNVTCVLARVERPGVVRTHDLLAARGVLGRRLPQVTPRTLPIAPGDVVIMTTDGVDARFQHELAELDPLQRAADDILRHYGAGTDDALIAMLRFRGTPS